MLLSARLKKWLIDNVGVKANADDETFRKAAGDAIAGGELTLELMTELSTTKADRGAQEVRDTLAQLGSVMLDIKSLLTANADEEEDDDDDDDAAELPAAKKAAKKAAVASTKKVADLPEGEELELPAKKAPRQIGLIEKAVLLMGGVGDEAETDDSALSVRVKSVAEGYSSTKSAMTYPAYNEKGRAHPLAGRPVQDFSDGGAGRAIDNPSELDKAVAGAWSKMLVQTALRKSRTMAFVGLPEHDKKLVLYAMENLPWGGASDGGDYADIKNRRLTPHEQKALIDDSTSGGLEAAPIVFDDQIIAAPLLNGELYPLVSSKPLDRGRRVEGVATGVVTGGWGGVDDTDIALFNTASYVSAFDTTVFRWEGAIRIGLDFLSDTPIDFGAHVTAQYGERLLEDLDDVIATGDGTTQPEGITVKSGVTSVAWGGSTSIGNYESLRFGVAKAEHKAGVAASAVFCGSETSYQRARAVPVGASDARRLGGGGGTLGGVGDYGTYNWMGLPYKINESMGNTKVFYAVLARYRMYRRRGLSMRTSTEGDTLIRKNEMLITATARFGGQLERAACAAKTSTAPA